MDDVRIQIVNYKTKSYLLRCLETIFVDLQDSDFKFSVAILDNASGDDLSDIPKIFSGRPIEVYQNKTNGGFGGGHNILAKHGDAKYLLLLNPDIKIIEPNTIKRLLNRAKDLNCEVLGCRLINVHGNTQRYDHGELYGFRAWVARNSGHAFWRERKNLSEVAWAVGAVFLIKKEWFDRLSGFDEKIFLYKEEEELCWRVRAEDGRVFYDPSITIFHHMGVVADISKYLGDSTDYFLQKHFKDRPGYGFFRWLNRKMNGGQ